MKILLALCASALLLPGVALAQASDQPSHSGYSQQQSQSNNQSSMNNQSQSNSAQEQTIEGCVTKRETDYYITPMNSTGTPVRLHGNQDLGSSENHHVRVTGHYQNGTSGQTTSQNSAYNGNSSYNSSNANGQSTSQNSAYNGNSTYNASNPNGTKGTTSQNSAYNGNSTYNTGNPGGQNGQDFLVTRVETVSSTCPANGGNSSH
jgi:hypothetical protein